LERDKAYEWPENSLRDNNSKIFFMTFQFVDYAVFASHPSSQRSGVPEGVNFPTFARLEQKINSATLLRF
jgi:hypothetical protein